MKNSDLEAKLKNTVDRLAPDVLDGILSKCETKQPGFVYLVQPQPPKRHWAYRAGMLAASFALVFGGLVVLQRMNYSRVDSRVMLDVNPSIELMLNRDDRVIKVETRNEDAVIILDNMDLENTPVDVAVNALIGSMLKHEYIQDTANSVLLSVESVNGEKSAALRRDLTQSISQQLTMVNGAVISQNLTEDERLELLADEYHISYGKAALIEKILDTNSHLLFADLAGLPVNELNLLVGSKRIEAEGLEALGSASDTAYIGEDRARLAALDHAGIDEIAAEGLRVELDYDDGGMVYDVEFYHDNEEYEYEIDAAAGTVIQYDRESRDGEDRQDDNQVSTSQSRDDFIGEAEAVKAAETHMGAKADNSPKVGLDKDDGIYIYEVEFQSGGQEYEYEIHATTGEILSWQAED